MLAIIGVCSCGGRMTPITPEAAIIQSASAGMRCHASHAACQTLITIVYSLIIFFVYKGHKIKALPEDTKLLMAEISIESDQAC